MEVGAAVDGKIVLRESGRPDATALRYTRDEWQAFVKGVKAGEFDDFC